MQAGSDALGQEVRGVHYITMRIGFYGSVNQFGKETEIIVL